MSHPTMAAGQRGYGGLSWREHWEADEGDTREAFEDVVELLLSADTPPEEMPEERSEQVRWVTQNYTAREVATMRAESGLCGWWEGE